MGQRKKMDDSQATALLADSDVEELQTIFAQIDLMHCGGGQSSFIEFLVLQREHTKVRMRPENNHQRPHFHIEYKQEYSASYAIDNLELLAGYMPRKYEAPILEWARGKQIPLRATWNELVTGKDVRELVIVKEKSQP